MTLAVGLHSAFCLHPSAFAIVFGDFCATRQPLLRFDSFDRGFQGRISVAISS